MERIGRAVVKHRILILVAAVLLLIPSVLGYFNVRINYDMLTYLPDEIDTVQGQNVLKDEFGKGAFSMIVAEGLDEADVASLTEEIKNVDHVVDALSYADVASGSGLPESVIPDEYRESVVNGDADLIAVFFDTGTSADETMQAVEEIRGLADEQVHVAGSSAMVTDLKNISEREESTYVGLAVLLAFVFLLILTDSWLAPFVFLTSIGIAIMYNLGSNILLGEISYVTKSLAAILQLAVTMDYSIFLWHGYTEKRAQFPNDHEHAMALAIADTLTALTSSMLTATAGFLALCFMSYTLGADLGLVMAKGCVLGFIGSVTILPSLILAFDKPLERLAHRSIIPSADGLARFTVKHRVAFLVAFVVIAVPAVYGFMNKPVYYDLSQSLVGADSNLSDEDIRFHVANEKLEENFDVATTEMVLCDSNLSHVDAAEMIDRIEEVDGVKYVIGYDSFMGGAIPDSFVPDDVKGQLKSGDYQLILVNSTFELASDEVNAQCEAINDIIKEYDDGAMLIGEAPATKDLIEITDFDFIVVDALAIVAILLILAIVFRSLTLPIILVLVIEFAIFINLGIPFYTGKEMGFIEPICISTIQLGSTVNYAILLTTRYKKERRGGLDAHAAVATAIRMSFSAICTSALTFFAATFGVGLYSNIGLIGSLTGIMARGAIISMFSVLFILPAMLVCADGVIVKTSGGFKPKKRTGEGAAAQALA